MSLCLGLWPTGGGTAYPSLPRSAGTRWLRAGLGVAALAPACFYLWLSRRLSLCGLFLGLPSPSLAPCPATHHRFARGLAPPAAVAAARCPTPASAPRRAPVGRCAPSACGLRACGCAMPSAPALLPRAPVPGFGGPRPPRSLPPFGRGQRAAPRPLAFSLPRLKHPALCSAVRHCDTRFRGLARTARLGIFRSGPRHSRALELCSADSLGLCSASWHAPPARASSAPGRATGGR